MNINCDLANGISLLSLSSNTSSHSFDVSLTTNTASRITQFFTTRHSIGSRSICLSELLDYIIKSFRATDFPDCQLTAQSIRIFGTELYKILGPDFILQQFQSDLIDDDTTSRLHAACKTAPRKLSIYFQINPNCAQDQRHVSITKLYQNLTDTYPGLKTDHVFKKDKDKTHLSGFGVHMQDCMVRFVFQTSSELPISCTQEALTLSLDLNSRNATVTDDSTIGLQWAHDTLYQIVRPCNGHATSDIDHLIRLVRNGHTLVANSHMPLPSRPLSSLLKDYPAGDFLTPLLIAIVFGDTPKVRDFIGEVLSKNLMDIENNFFLDSLNLIQTENLSIKELQALMQCIAHYGHVTRPGMTVKSNQLRCSFNVYDQVLTITSDTDASRRIISTIPLQALRSEACFKWLSHFTDNPELFLIQTFSFSNSDVAQKLLQHPRATKTAKMWAISTYIQTNPDLAVGLMQSLANDATQEQMTSWTNQLPQHTLFYSKLLASSAKWARACVQNDLDATLQGLQTVSQPSVDAIIQAITAHTASSISQDTLLQLLPFIFDAKRVKTAPQFISWALRQLHTYDGALNKEQKAAINQQFQAFIAALREQGLAEEYIQAIQIQQRHSRQDLDNKIRHSLVWAFSRLANDHPLLQWYILLVETHIIQPKHEPFLQVHLLLTSAKHIEYLKLLKSQLKPDELSQIEEQIRPLSLPDCIQALFTRAAPKKKAAAQNTSPFADLIGKKKWSELATRLLQNPPSAEHASTTIKTIDSLLLVKDSHTVVFSLLVHYQISSIEQWKKVLKHYDNTFDTTALTHAVVTIMGCKDTLDKKCLAALYEEIIKMPHCLNHPHTLCVLQEFETIVTALRERLQQPLVRAQMAQLVSIWLKHDVTKYLPQLYSWYLEFADDLKKDPTIAYRLVELCPVDADCQNFQKCGGILLSITPHIKSIVFKQSNSRQKAQSTLTMNPIINFFKAGRRWAEDDLSVTIMKTTVNVLQGLNNPHIDEVLLTLLHDFPDTSIKQELLTILNKYLPTPPQSLKKAVHTLVINLMRHGDLKTKSEILTRLLVLETRTPSNTSLSDLVESFNFPPSQETLVVYRLIAEYYIHFLRDCLKSPDPSYLTKALDIALSIAFNKTADVEAIFKKHIADYDALLVELFMAQLAYAGWRSTSEHLLPQLLHKMLSNLYIKKESTSDHKVLQELYEFIYSSPTNQKYYQYTILGETKDAMPVISLSSSVQKFTPRILPSQEKFSKILSSMLTLALEHINKGKISKKSRLNLLDFVAQCLRNLLEVRPEQENLELLIHDYVRCIKSDDEIFEYHNQIACAIVRMAIFKNSITEESVHVQAIWQHLSLTRDRLLSQDLEGLSRISEAIENFDHEAPKDAKLKTLDAILVSLYLWQEFYCVSAYKERLACLQKLFELCKRQERLIAHDHIKGLIESILLPNTAIFAADRGPLGQEHGLQCMQEYINCYFDIYSKHTEHITVCPAPVKQPVKASAKSSAATKGQYITTPEELAALVALEPLLQMFKKATYSGLYKDHYVQFAEIIRRFIPVMTSERKLNIECFIQFIGAFTSLITAPILDTKAQALRPDLVLEWLESIQALNTPLKPLILKLACTALIEIDILDDIAIASLPKLAKILNIIATLDPSECAQLQKPIAAQLSRIKFDTSRAEEAALFIKELPPFISRLISQLEHKK